MNKASFKVYFNVYIVALILSILSGTYLKIVCEDPVTGFINTVSTLDIVARWVYRLCFIIPIPLWFFISSKRRAQHDYPISYRSTTSGILSILTGICMILYTVTAAGGQVVALTNDEYRTLGVLSGTLSNKIVLLVLFLLGITGGLSMIVGGARPKYGVGGKPGAILGFVPALWQLIIVLTRYNHFIAVSTMNDILMVILFMCFAALFLIGHSRIVFGLGIRSGKTYALPTGFALSLIGLSFTITNTISLLFSGKFVTSSLDMGIPEFAYIFFLSLYAIVFLIGFSRSIKKV